MFPPVTIFSLQRIQACQTPSLLQCARCAYEVLALNSQQSNNCTTSCLHLYLMLRKRKKGLGTVSYLQYCYYLFRDNSMLVYMLLFDWTCEATYAVMFQDSFKGSLQLWHMLSRHHIIATGDGREKNNQLYQVRYLLTGEKDEKKDTGMKHSQSSCSRKRTTF